MLSVAFIRSVPLVEESIHILHSSIALPEVVRKHTRRKVRCNATLCCTRKILQFYPKNSTYPWTHSLPSFLFVWPDCFLVYSCTSSVPVVFHHSLGIFMFFLRTARRSPLRWYWEAQKAILQILFLLKCSPSFHAVVPLSSFAEFCKISWQYSQKTEWSLWMTPTIPVTKDLHLECRTTIMILLIVFSVLELYSKLTLYLYSYWNLIFCYHIINSLYSGLHLNLQS